MNISPKSIKGRLFLWLFFSNSLLLFITSIIIYDQIKASVFNSVNNILHSKVEMINNMLEKVNGRINLELTEFVSGEYTVPGSGHYYKVVIKGKKENNNVIASPSLVSKNFNLASGKLESEDKKLGESIYTTIGPNNEPIRVLQKNINFFGVAVTIFSGENIQKSLDIIENSEKIIFIIFPLAIILFGIIVLWISKISLKPLEEFSTEVRRISHKNLDKKINTESNVTELNELILTFNDMLDRIKKAFDVEKFIISEASHKLKTPVTVIQGYCDVILQRERDKTEYIDTLQTIRRFTRNISNLINGILSVTNLDSGHLTFQSFQDISVNSCLLKAVELSKSLASQKNITFNLSIDNDLVIPGDEDKLTEAFVNIIENAVKYNKENGFINIKTIKNTDHIEILIQDTGFGIKDDEIAKIFERFYRSNSVRKIEGSGLGLNIAKLIIESHSGSITASSEYGVSTEFKIIFPG